MMHSLNMHFDHQHHLMVQVDKAAISQLMRALKTLRDSSKAGSSGYDKIWANGAFERCVFMVYLHKSLLTSSTQSREP